MTNVPGWGSCGKCGAAFPIGIGAPAHFCNHFPSGYPVLSEEYIRQIVREVLREEMKRE